MYLRKGLEIYFITGKEFYKVNIQNGDPHARRIDPRNIVFDDSFIQTI